MSKWTSDDVRKLTENIRAYCDQHDIIVGVDQRKIPTESVVYYVFQGVNTNTAHLSQIIAVNLNTMLSVEYETKSMLDWIDKKMRSTLPSKGDRLTIKNVIFNDPATIVFWDDGSKSVVKARDGEKYDPEKGLAMAISRKALGNTGSYYNEFEKWLPKNEVKISPYMQALFNCFMNNGRPSKPYTDGTDRINGKPHRDDIRINRKED